MFLILIFPFFILLCMLKYYLVEALFIIFICIIVDIVSIIAAAQYVILPSLPCFEVVIDFRVNRMKSVALPCNSVVRDFICQ